MKYLHYQEVTNRSGVLQIPEGSKFLTVLVFKGAIRVYYEDSENPARPLLVPYRAIYTGDAVPDLLYRGTVTQGAQVYHIYTGAFEDETNMTRPIQTPVLSQLEKSSQAVTVNESDHKGLSFMYRKKDGTTRLVRLSRFITGVTNDRQWINGIDAERDDNFRTLYLDQIVGWAKIV